MSIATSIFSNSQSRVYLWLFGQPDRSYHLSELLRLTGLGSASLQRELNRLVASKLVLSDRLGSLRCFRANSQSPIFNELVALTRKTLGMVPLLQDALRPLMPRLQLAFIYGSVAKQTDTAQSDIDVMLVGRDLLLSDVLALLVPIEAQLGRKINPNFFTPEEFCTRRAEHDSFVNRVLSQAVIELIGDAHEPARIG